MLSRGLGTKLEQYRDGISATGELIGRDFSHWLA
jgi:hypothetical protein